jgi:transcriptional regulator with XRE-family HTH domain
MVARRRKAKRKPYAPIDPDKFRYTRESARLSREEAACILHVTPRTIQLWEKGTSAIPYAAFKLLRILCRYDLPGSGWEDWCLHSGALWSPAGDRFDPARLSYLANPLAMADMWRKDYERRNALRVQQALQDQLRLGKPQLRLVK